MTQVRHAATVFALLALTACARPWVGDIRPEAARYLVRVRTEPDDSQLGGLVVAEVTRYRRARTRHISVDSAAGIQVMLIVGLAPDPSVPGGRRLAGRLVNVTTSVVERGFTLTPSAGQTWRDLVPELIDELLRKAT